MDRNPDEYETMSMIFGAASSPSIAQYVMRSNVEDFSKKIPGSERTIRQNHYMADYLDSVPFFSFLTLHNLLNRKFIYVFLLYCSYHFFCVFYQLCI